MKVICLFFIIPLFFSQTICRADSFTLSGKIRLKDPVTIQLQTLSGESVFTVNTEKDGSFNSGEFGIIPDIYRLTVGDLSRKVYLENKAVTMKGVYNPQSPERSVLSFKGMDPYFEIADIVVGYFETENMNRDQIDRLSPSEVSALAYLLDIGAYEPNKELLNRIPEDKRVSLSAEWLERRVDSLSVYALGAPAYDFTYEDIDGQSVRLSDFRGKMVLVDFWASWCVPCRQEMKSLALIYEELKGDDLVFISVSVDKRRSDWEKMLQQERHPWIMLWDKEGFGSGNRLTRTQQEYGFQSIPFILLIDREGKIFSRKLRGEKVKESILRLREQTSGK